jgi:hypothetical protein
MGESAYNNGYRITQRLKNITFNGMSGRVILDQNGDRRADWSWYITSHEFHPLT